MGRTLTYVRGERAYKVTRPQAVDSPDEPVWCSVNLLLSAVDGGANRQYMVHQDDVKARSEGFLQIMNPIELGDWIRQAYPVFGCMDLMGKTLTFSNVPFEIEYNCTAGELVGNHLEAEQAA